jgi:hypothetical protein
LTLRQKQPKLLAEALYPLVQQQGAFTYTMQPQNPNIKINLDLIDQVVDRIPEWTWSVVKDRLVTDLVDAMTTPILERLTGDPGGDDRAQEILDDYYASSDRNKDLIVDSFTIIGEEQTLYSLDSLQLDKITAPTSQEDYDRG